MNPGVSENEYEQVCQHERGITLVPNRVALQLRLAAWHASSGRPAVFRAPPIFPFSEWMARLAEHSGLLRGEATPAVAGRFSLRHAWECVIAHDRRDWLPAEVTAMAQQAMEADRLLCHWADGDDRHAGSAAWLRFRRWRPLVQETLAARHAVTPQNQLAGLRDLLRGAQLPHGLLPRELRLDGFSETTRLEQEVLDALAAAGVKVGHPGTAEPKTQDIEAFRLPGPDDEFRYVAAWARRQVEAGAHRVGVVVNDLDHHAARLLRAFENEFLRAELLGFSLGGTRPFRLPRGAPLSDHPLVSTAVELLELTLGGMRQRHDFHRISRLLTCPAVAGWTRERFARARLEHRLRETGRFRWSLAGVAEMAGACGVPALRERLARLPAWNRELPPERAVQALLEHWGWPGELPRDETAQRAVQGFVAGLEAWSRLDFAHPAAAVGALRSRLEELALDSGGGALSPIQILAPDDAVDADFSVLALVNFHAGNWPGPCRPHPLLPASINRQIPRASVDGQFEYVMRLHRSLLGQARQILCTRSDAQGGVPRADSPLMPVSQPAAAVIGSLADVLYPDIGRLQGYARHPWLRARTECEGLPLATDVHVLERAVDRLNHQAACPLAAYLVHRLGARFESRPGPFASPAFVGSVVHRAMERLYSPHLDAATRPGPEEVPAAVNEALEHTHAELRLAPVPLAAERRRLVHLLRAWLAAEGGWAPTRPVALEKDIQGRLGGFELNLRIDRIDRLADGRWFVLDYKTGAIARPKWEHPRPLDLQLPLYATLVNGDREASVGAVALASVRQGAIERRGLADDPELAGAGIEGFAKPGTLAKALGGWADALAKWQVTFEALLQEHASGDCRHWVVHKQPLAYLGLAPLLRHAALAAWMEAQEGSADA